MSELLKFIKRPMQHEQNVSHAMPAKWYVDGWQMEDIQDWICCSLKVCSSCLRHVNECKLSPWDVILVSVRLCSKKHSMSCHSERWSVGEREWRSKVQQGAARSSKEQQGAARSKKSLGQVGESTALQESGQSLAGRRTLQDISRLFLCESLQRSHWLRQDLFRLLRL